MGDGALVRNQATSGQINGEADRDLGLVEQYVNREFEICGGFGIPLRGRDF